jgi:ABC-type glutathione transport system ATPase component
MTLLDIRDVSKIFVIGGQPVHALHPISLTLEKGECHAVVGESGSGKSTLANLILGVHAPTSGTIEFEGKALPSRRPRELRRRIQFVQQNPYSALNPRHSIGQSIALGLSVHFHASRAELAARVEALLRDVDLDPALANRYPAALSGGQRQRVAIARALGAKPDLLVLDEPTSALDVLVQARVLELLARLRRERGITYLFISHDLSVVRNLADRVSVFEKGRLVETGETSRLFEAPSQDYTRRLIASTPVVSADEAALRDHLAAMVAT